MHNQQRNKPSTDEQKENNAEISKVRWIIEQGYCTLIWRFKASRTRHMGLAKVATEMTGKAICFNL